MIPVLFTTWNRLEYTKRSLESLAKSKGIRICIIDNGSTDGTVEYLETLMDVFHIEFNKENKGIAGAMNRFLELTPEHKYVGKVDNDTLVPRNWAIRLRDKCEEQKIDIIQARHPISDAVFKGGNFDHWMKTMRQNQDDKSIYYHHFVGGSGIIFRRHKMYDIPYTEWKLYGWNTFQKSRPDLKKAFCTDVTIELLDAHGYTDYPEYYRETRRIK